MTSIELPHSLTARLEQARELDRSGQSLQAEILYLAILKERPGSPEVTPRLAKLALDRGDGERAIRLLETAVRAYPRRPSIGLELAFMHLALRRPHDGLAVLDATLAATPDFPPAWLLAGQVHDALGDGSAALRAYYEAVTRAQRAGAWLDERTTPGNMLQAVARAIERVRAGQRELFFGAFDNLRQQFGAASVQRVERALTGYLREWDATPPDKRQRPKFLYFPDIPCPPYHDPYLQPWARQLEAAFPAIRGEALKVLAEDNALPDFIDIRAGEKRDTYVGGEAANPSWEAFFFYRRGKRFDAHHARCPQTSAVLESLELCRIAEQAPEICFSVLRPGSLIKAHHGVTNTRLVMHLPLIVPADCALNLVGAGEHHWQEGKLVMFDDTFLHEAWNRSPSTRVILLMDCWNPHLTSVERQAVKQLVELIAALRTPR